MIKKFLKTFFLIIIFIFFFLIIKIYLSEQNKIITNKSRTSYLIDNSEKYINIPILKNDTKNIISYKNDLEEFKKKRKKRFWEKLISKYNE
jgi:cbb3-type cytochrome oxidase subunit 3